MYEYTHVHALRMATAESILHSGQMPTQLKFRSKATSQRSFEEPSSTTPQEDPLRILVPAQKKLNTIESQRVLSIVNETTRRLETALVIPSLADSLDRFSIPLGSVLVNLLQEYTHLTAEFETTVESLSSLRQGHCTSTDDGEPDETPHVECSKVEEQCDIFQQRIRHCVKSILRAVSTNPSVVQAIQQKKTAIHTQLIETLHGLQSVSNEMLLTTKMEEMKRKEHMLLVARRRQSAEENIQRLEAELATVQKHKNEMVCCSM